MNKFYKRKSDGKEFKAYRHISNGTILTKFDERTGTPIVNTSYQMFVSKDELKELFTPFEFKLDSTEAMNRIIADNLSEVVYQMRNYGIAEEAVSAFQEFTGSSPITCSVIRDMVKDDKSEFKDFLTNDDDAFEFAAAEDLFNFLKDGLVPILKKMLIEAENVRNT